MNNDQRSLMRRRIDEFHERHGGVCIDVKELGLRVYPDGAFRDIDPHGVLGEPDRDLHKRSQMIFEYWQERTERAVEAFETTKERIEGLAELVLRERSAPALPFSKDSATAELTTLRDEVKRCQRCLRKARADVKKNEPPHLKQRAQRNAKNRERASEMLSATRSFQI